MKYLYCLEAYPARMIRICLQDGNKEVIYTIDNGTPDGIWIDKPNQKIFWTVMGKKTTPPEGYFDHDGSIDSCNLDGSGHQMIIGNGKITTPKQITGDTTSKRLYWCDREGMAVMSSNMDGSDFCSLLHYMDSTSEIDNIEQQCVGIALDPKGQYLYWTQKGPSKGGKGKILRMKLAEDQQFPISTDNVEVLIDNLPEPIDLEFGDITGKLYWTDRGAPPYGNSLNCAVISENGEFKDYHVLATGLKEGIGLAVDENDHVVYTSDLGGFIRKIDLVDNSESVLAQLGPTTGIALLK